MCACVVFFRACLCVSERSCVWLRVCVCVHLCVRAGVCDTHTHTHAHTYAMQARLVLSSRIVDRLGLILSRDDIN